MQQYRACTGMSSAWKYNCRYMTQLSRISILSSVLLCILVILFKFLFVTISMIGFLSRTKRCFWTGLVNLTNGS